MKGGSRSIQVDGNRFEYCGGRAINVGGSTDAEFFRPPLKSWKTPLCEARGIVVQNNEFIGGGAPVAFVGVDGSIFAFNTVNRQRRYCLRILQETMRPGFVPSRRGEFSSNIIVYRSDEVREACNTGPNTSPETFKFSDNFWYCLDAASHSKPQLPAAEQNGKYGQDPRLSDPESGNVRPRSDSPARGFGAQSVN